MSDNMLITTYTFYNRQYLLKLNSANCLEIVLTDKQTGEEWECSYDIAYIEHLTRRTGNFKQFEVFATMLKSGLLKTSECISLDLLTYEDLESMKVRKVKSSSKLAVSANNRRYLIVTYSVEFDKIKYPIPLDYCGPPDPTVLQAAVKKLEAKLKKAEDQLCSKNHNGDKRQIKSLQRRIDELMIENRNLNDEIKRLNKLLNKNPGGQVQVLQKAIMQLEKSVQSERNSHHRLVQKLQLDKMMLTNELERFKKSETALRSKIQGPAQNYTKNNPKSKKLPRYDSKESNKNNLKIGPRSRSASPRVIHLDKYCARDAKPSQYKLKPQSRSSSTSSKKEFWNNFSGSETLTRSRESSPSSKNHGSTSTVSHSSLGYNSRGVNERTKFSAAANRLENRFNKVLRKYI